MVLEFVSCPHPTLPESMSKVAMLTWNGMGLEGDHETFSAQNVISSEKE